MSQEQQDDQDYDNQSEPAAREIAPASAVRPGGQRTQKEQNQNHNQNGANHFSSPFANKTEDRQSFPMFLKLHADGDRLPAAP
jgi:hypothetical protein